MDYHAIRILYVKNGPLHMSEKSKHNLALIAVSGRAYGGIFDDLHNLRLQTWRFT